MKPKRLNLQQIAKIYSLLKPAIEGRESEVIIFDEVSKIIELSSPEVLLECLNILYDNKAKVSNVPEFLKLLLDGLIKNDFFEFVDFIKALKNGSSK